MWRRGAGWSAVVALMIAGGCSDGGGGGGQPVCPAEEPNGCYGPSGELIGCCASGRECSADNKQCVPVTSGGASGSSGAAGTGASGGSAGSTSFGGTGGGFGGSGGGTGGTGGVGGSTGGVGGGTGGVGGVGGSGGSVPCDDPGFEPNETEASATGLGSYTDCDSTGTSVSGQLDGTGDTDFYVYAGSDVTGCIVDPTATTGAKVRLCAFAECTGVSVSCTKGSPTASPSGRPGCCVASGGTVTLNVNCSGFSDNATIYMRVDQPSANACTPYTLDFHY